MLRWLTAHDRGFRRVESSRPRLAEEDDGGRPLWDGTRNPRHGDPTGDGDGDGVWMAAFVKMRWCEGETWREG